MKHLIPIMVILLLVSTSFVGVSYKVEKSSTISFDGNTLYVGGSGPNNYTRIQDAINDAGYGDTVFVYNGIYFENLIIDKSVNLIGEDKDSTVIDGKKSGDVLYIFEDSVNFTGFTVQNSGDDDFDAGIEVRSNYNTITGNLIHDNGGKDYNDQGGIYLNSSSYNNISNNIIYQNDMDGIFMVQSDYNHIHDNTIYDNGFIAMIISDSSYNVIENNDMYESYCCMSFWPYSTHNMIQHNSIHDHPGCGMAFKIHSDDNIIRYNNLSNNKEWGIMLGPGPTIGNVIEYNTISKTTGPGYWYGGSGLVLQNAYFNKIKKNNIMENRINVYLNSSIGNIWFKNYWDNFSGFGPKIIFGKLAMPWNPKRTVPWINIDWHPAKEPYDI